MTSGEKRENKKLRQLLLEIHMQFQIQMLSKTFFATK